MANGGLSGTDAKPFGGIAARFRLWLLTELNAGAAVTLLFVALDRSPATRIAIADYGAFYGSLLLFVLVPLGFLGVLLLTFVSRRRSSKGWWIYVAASSLFLAFAWFQTTIPATFLIHIWQPWPLSLKQGPDTDYARDGYTKILGRAPPTEVSEIYYRGLAIMGESDDYLRFRYRHPALIEKIVAQFDLIEVTAEERKGALVGFVQVFRDPMSWWPAERINNTDRVFVDRGTRAFAYGERTADALGRMGRILWLDRTDQTVFYMQHRE